MSTNQDDALRAMSSLVRVGMVTDVDYDNRLCRVKYEDRGYTSNWLKVLDNRDYIPTYNGTQRTEYESGGSGYALFANHMHLLNIKPWMPEVGRKVLVLYVPAKNSDGYVLGGL